MGLQAVWISQSRLEATAAQRPSEGLPMIVRICLGPGLRVSSVNEQSGMQVLRVHLRRIAN